METTLTIFKAIAFISIIFSTLFISAKLYTYFARKEDDECSEDCSCHVTKTVNPQITDAVTVKPKRKPAKKRVSAIDKKGKLVVTPVEEKPKRGRKKKA